jgi:hypothetical protein
MIREEQPRIQTDLAGITVGTGSKFPIPFPYWEKSHIRAILTKAEGDVPLNENPPSGAGYTLTEPNGINGELTPVGNWAGALRLTMYREIPLTQPVDLQNGSRINAEQLERMADRCIAIAQQLKVELKHTVRLSLSEPADLVFPAKEARAGKYLGFDGTGRFRVGLDRVNNTSDAEKPLSALQRAAVNALQGLIQELSFTQDEYRVAFSALKQFTEEQLGPLSPMALINENGAYWVTENGVQVVADDTPNAGTPALELLRAAINILRGHIDALQRNIHAATGLIQELSFTQDEYRVAFSALKQFVEEQHGPLSPMALINENGAYWVTENGVQVVV